MAHWRHRCTIVSCNWSQSTQTELHGVSCENFALDEQPSKDAMLSSSFRLPDSIWVESAISSFELNYISWICRVRLWFITPTFDPGDETTTSFFYNKQLYRLSSHLTKQTFIEGCITIRSTDQKTTKRAVATQTNSPTVSWCVAGGEDNRVKRPRQASVEVGTTESLLDSTLCDRRMS